MNSITAVIVSYNREDLLRKAYESLRKWSDMPVIIVDGSTADNSCDDYARSLQARNTMIISVSRNIGHGCGMEMGITKARTRYILLMDSDVEILMACWDNMLLKFQENTFGVGQIVPVDSNGTNADPGPDAISYLHPHFAMIDREIYRNVPGFVHHGAPCIRTMQYLKTFGKYNLVEFPVWSFIRHAGRGTRSLNPPEFLNGWQ